MLCFSVFLSFARSRVNRYAKILVKSLYIKTLTRGAQVCRHCSSGGFKALPLFIFFFSSSFLHLSLEFTYKVFGLLHASRGHAVLFGYINYGNDSVVLLLVMLSMQSVRTTFVAIYFASLPSIFPLHVLFTAAYSWQLFPLFSFFLPHGGFPETSWERVYDSRVVRLSGISRDNLARRKTEVIRGKLQHVRRHSMEQSQWP